jgi:hypothetical protein
MAGNIEMSWAIFSCFAASCFMLAASWSTPCRMVASSSTTGLSC